MQVEADVEHPPGAAFGFQHVLAAEIEAVARQIQEPPMRQPERFAVAVVGRLDQHVAVVLAPASTHVLGAARPESAGHQVG